MKPTQTLAGAHAPMLLHPRYVLRIAGEPAALLDVVDTGETAAALAEQRRLRAAVASQAGVLCAALEAVVHGCTDRDLGRAALNAKRAIFNGKPPRADHVALVAPVLDAGIVEALERFAADATALAGTEAAVRAAHARETEATSPRLAALWARPRLQDAISYVNPELYADFAALADPDAKPLAAKARRKIEDTFVQYVARCASKTSPLSTFTMMHVGRWQEDAGAEPGWALDVDPAVDRRVQLKGALARQLVAPLVADFATATRLFALRLNPSAEFRDGRVRFRVQAAGNTSSGRYWGTGESVSEIVANPVLNCLRHVFSARGQAAIRLPDLVAAMCGLAPKLQPPVVHDFAARLYALGLLVADVPVLEQDEPLDWLARIVADLPGEAGTAARAQVDAIVAALAAFPQAEPAGRARLVSDVQSAVTALRDALGANPNAAIEHPAFFENAYLHRAHAELPTALLAPFARDLELLLLLSPVVSFNQQARSQMADFFLARHGADGRCDDPVGFIEAFDAAFGPGDMAHQPDPARQTPPSPVTAAWTDARRKLVDTLAPLLAAGQDVQLTRAELGPVIDALPQAVRRRGSSQSYLAQVATREGRPRLVVNQIFGGRSGLMSRFMEVLDPMSLKEVRDYVRDGSESGIVAELPGVFGFNANRHPRLADHEVTVAPFAANFPESTQLALASLHLVYDEREHAVRLRTPDGRDLDLWYQGFLMPMLLPRVQRVLALAGTDGISNFTIGAMTRLARADASRVTYVPRVSLGDIVIGRRTWIVPVALQPDAELSTEEFFLALQRCRDELGLPEEAFVRGMPMLGSAAGGAVNGDGGTDLRAVKWEEVDFKDLKPFHVRFGSPRLVRLLQRMLKRNRNPIVVSEVLPTLDDQHVRIAGAGHVAEIQFELTTLPQRLAQPAAAWHALRIAYFDEDRRDLVLGPIAAALDTLRDAHGLTRAMLLPHWKRGPHLDLVVHCADTTFESTVEPLVRAHVEPWLAAHPSTRTLDAAAYEALSHKLALHELEAGPFLPLLADNRVTRAAYQPPRALKLPEFAAAREDFQSASLPLMLDLLRAKPADADAFFLALAAMLALAADTYEIDGLARGYVSLRSHAEYFFHAYGDGVALRARFDALDRRLGAQLDAVIALAHAGDIDALALPEPLRDALHRWQAIVQATALENRRIVRLNHDVLLVDETFERLQSQVTRDGPADYQRSMRARVASELGQAIARPAHQRAMNSRQMLAYRSTLNFFYTLLPLLGVSPMQKFCLCHLVALSVERVLGTDWRTITGLAAAPEVQS